MSMEIEYERQVLKSASTNIYGITLDSEIAPDAIYFGQASKSTIYKGMQTREKWIPVCSYVRVVLQCSNND